MRKLCLVLLWLGAAGVTAAQETPARPPLKERVKKAVDRGLRYLHGRFDLEAGAWKIRGRPAPGVTALAVLAFATSPRKYRLGDGPFVDKAAAYLAGLARPDGSIHDGELANYKTSAAVQALVAVGGGKKYRPVIEKARRYLERIQLDESEGYPPEHRYYGGAGYGGDLRPDLSNVSLWIDGLLAAGAQPGAEPFRRALVFLERCQNDSEVNKGRYERDGKVYVAGNDGGGVYAPGESKAGYDRLPDGTYVPRSYGSMTYALLKGYMAAALKKDDPRVQAAMGWIAHHFTLAENPGFDTSKDPRAGLQGLYYYYWTLARALDLYGEEEVRDAQGRLHRWRAELAEKLLSLQRPDGSWVNPVPRWWEGLPVLATAYAVLALNVCNRGL